jgi:hypothetical protein
VDPVNLSINYNVGGACVAQVANLQASPQGTSGNVVPNFTLSYGTGTVLDANGAVPVNGLYVYQASLAASGTKSANMNGGTDVDAATGALLVWTKLKYWFVANLGIAGGAPDGLLYLLVGPDSVATSAVAGFNASTNAIKTYWSMSYRGPAAGETVTAATAMLFNVNNPGASALNILIVLAGKT